MPMQNPVVGGGGGLIRNWVQSPDFLTGVRGWRIARDGSAEFNNITARGTVIIVNGNERIDLLNNSSPGVGPSLRLNPNTTLFNPAVVWVTTDGVEPTVRASLIMQSPYSLTQGSPATVQAKGATNAHPDRRVLLDAEISYAGSLFFEEDARESLVTGNSTAVTPGNALDIVTQSVIAPGEGASIEVKASWHGIGFVTPVAFPGNQVTMRLTRNGTQIRSCRILGQNTALTQFGGQLVAVDTPGAGTHTYALSLLHEGGSTAASVHTVATANSPSSVSVSGFGIV